MSKQKKKCIIKFNTICIVSIIIIIAGIIAIYCSFLLQNLISKLHFASIILASILIIDLVLCQLIGIISEIRELSSDIRKKIFKSHKPIEMSKSHFAAIIIIAIFLMLLIIIPLLIL